MYRRTKIDANDLAARLTALGADAGEAARVAKVETVQPVDPNRSALAKRNQRRGLAIEGEYGGKGATAVLRSEGYARFPNPGGKTAADVVARRISPDVDGPPLRAVQCKRVALFAAWALNDAVARYLGIGRWSKPYAFPDGTREVWQFVDRRGWVARAVIYPDDTIKVTGEEAERVSASIQRMVTSWKAAQRAPSAKHETLRERLLDVASRSIQ